MDASEEIEYEAAAEVDSVGDIELDGDFGSFGELADRIAEEFPNSELDIIVTVRCLRRGYE